MLYKRGLENRGRERSRWGARTPMTRLRGARAFRLPVFRHAGGGLALRPPARAFTPSTFTPSTFTPSTFTPSIFTLSALTLASIVGLSGLLILSLAAPGRAQSTMPNISGPPDVLVIVYQQPGGADQVDITYAHAVPRAQASRDASALTAATGWPIGPGSIKDAAAPMHSTFGPMTSVVFQQPGVVQDASHTFPVESFARAFRAYKRLNLVFFAGPQFVFQGSRAYADNGIKMALDQHGAAFVYQIEITNPNFGALTLAPPTPAAPGGAGHRTPWLIFLGIFGAALTAGLIVYFLTARLTATPGTASEDNSEEGDDPKSDDTAETRLEVGSGR